MVPYAFDMFTLQKLKDAPGLVQDWLQLISRRSIHYLVGPIVVRLVHGRRILSVLSALLSATQPLQAATYLSTVAGTHTLSLAVSNPLGNLTSSTAGTKVL
jgi:hypothetical protein